MTGVEMIATEDKQLQKVGAALLFEQKKLFEVVYESDKCSELEKNVRLDTVYKLQQLYPELIVGGSTALFLYGLRLSRFYNTKTHDIDFISPYFIDIRADGFERRDTSVSSGNDFDQRYHFVDNSPSTLPFDDAKYFEIDLLVNPKAQYTTQEYNGKKYKTADPLEILAAKIRYRSNPKHREDILEMLGHTVYQSYLLEKNTNAAK